MTAVRLIPVLWAGLATSACGVRELKIDIEPTYSDINRIVLQSKCIHCHSSLATYSGLLQIVTPGSARGSELYEVIAEGEMPIQTAPLSDKEVAAIREWINNGALNN